MPRAIPPLHMTRAELRAWYASHGIAQPAAPSSGEMVRARQIRQARFYARRRASGLCKSCAVPVGDDQSRCDECRRGRWKEAA